jgi:hypothetical protein
MMAQALREWIPSVLDEVKPWFSGKDIPAGERWLSEVGTRLEDTNFGILCLTRDNVQSPWLLFEAGALSKSVQEGAVCPYLLDLDLREIQGPLSQFQAKKTDKVSTLEIVQEINKRLTSPLDSAPLSKRYDALWPDLQRSLDEISEDLEPDRAPTRPEPEILEELVGRVRAMDSRFANIETQLRMLQRPMPPSARSSRPITGALPIRLDVVMATPSTEKGRSVNLWVSEGTDLKRAVASVLELDPTTFEQDWYLLDPRNGSPLSSYRIDDLIEYFGDSPAVLKVTDIPF